MYVRRERYAGHQTVRIDLLSYQIADAYLSDLKVDCESLLTFESKFLREINDSCNLECRLPSIEKLFKKKKNTSHNVDDELKIFMIFLGGSTSLI